MRSTITTVRPCCATSATPRAPRQRSTRPSRCRPQDYEAYNGRAQLRRQTRERNHVAEIEAVLATATSPAGRVELCHALAKELEDLGDFDASFARLKQGADLKRRHMRYDVGTDLDIMRRICEVFGSDDRWPARRPATWAARRSS